MTSDGQARNLSKRKRPRPQLLSGSRVNGKVDANSRSTLPRASLDRSDGIVVFGYAFYDRKTKNGTEHVCSTDAVKTLKDAVSLILGDARPIVPYVINDLACPTAKLDGNVSTFWRIVDCIVDRIVKRELATFLITAYLD